MACIWSTKKEFKNGWTLSVVMGNVVNIKGYGKDYQQYGSDFITHEQLDLVLTDLIQIIETWGIPKKGTWIENRDDVSRIYAVWLNSEFKTVTIELV